MAQTVYECMFLYDSNSYARNPAGVAEGITKIIESVGGEVIVSRLYNEQKLAYPINGHRKGVYWLAYFRLESTDLAKFNRQCQLTDRLMRHLCIKIDDRLVEPLIAAAKGESVDTTSAAAEEKESKTSEPSEAKAETVAAGSESAES